MSETTKLTDLFKSDRVDPYAHDFFAQGFGVQVANSEQVQSLCDFSNDILERVTAMGGFRKDEVFSELLAKAEELLQPQTESERCYALMLTSTYYKAVMARVKELNRPSRMVGELLKWLSPNAAAHFTVEVNIPPNADTEAIKAICNEAFNEAAQKHFKERRESADSEVSNDNTEAGR